MFTGIVEATGTVVETTDDEGGRRIRIRPDTDAAGPNAADDAGSAGTDAFADLHHGQSIAVSGVCLTVEEFRTGADPWFEVFLAAETVEKTYLGSVGAGDRVNLERALAADGRFDGHLVQGHVDTTGEVLAVERVGDDWFFEFALPPEVARYVVEKGSVALDGISLTVADRREDRFAVAIIPTTYELTTLSEKSVGDPIHLEVDVVAKYVEQLVSGYRDAVVGE
ncbi:riboflavin synthase [Halobellus sp. GM3]|uniref:riboflavin synthase n=1 Tax=Halobellus sp. GM3 TaxID=3458410 RepID=UPI00403E34C4